MTDLATRIADAKQKAEAAKCLWPDNEWYISERGRIADLDPEDGDYIAAASPDLFLAMASRIEELENALEAAYMRLDPMLESDALMEQIRTAARALRGEK